MGVLDVLRGVVGDETFRLIECRNCGEKLEVDTDACPVCDSDEISVYEF